MAIRASYTTLPDLAALPGRGGGQVLIGGTQSGADLTLASNPFGNGLVFVGNALFVDETGATKKIGILTFSPQNAVDMPVDVRFRGAGTGSLVVTNDVLGVAPGAGGVWNRDTSAGNLYPTVQTDTVTVLNTILSTTANAVFDFTTSQYAVPVGGLPPATLRIPVLVNGVAYDIGLSLHGTGPASPPTAPTTLTATAASSSQINLAWTDNSTDETGFKIERSRDNFSTFIALTTTAANVTTYADTGLLTATAYSYRVRATNTNGDSANSNVATATTLGTGLPQDTFTRNDSNTLGTSSSGNAWDEWLPTGVTFGFAIQSNQAAPGATSSTYTFLLATLEGQTATGTFQVKLAQINTPGNDNFGLAWRWNAAASQANSARTGYLIQTQSSNSQYGAVYWNGTAFSSIASNLGGLTPTSGDILRVTLSNITPKLTIYISQNGGTSFTNVYQSTSGTEAGGLFDNNAASTQHGLIAQPSANDLTLRWDEYSQIS